MHDLWSKILLHLHGAWRMRWLAVTVAWLVALVGWAVVWAMPNTYVASAQVYVDTESMLRPLLSGLAVGTDVRSDVNMMSTVMLSRPNLERVARDTDLYLRAPSPQDFDVLVRSLTQKIQLTSNGRDSTYAISYGDTDRQMALRVVQTLLNTFVEDTLGIKKDDSATTQRFLQEQITAYETKLRQAEERLADFKRKNVGLMPGQTGDYYTRLQTALTNVETLQAKYHQLSERRAELERQVQGEEPTFGIIEPHKTGPNDAKIADLKRQLDQLLLQYTEKHPQVIAIKEQITRLEEDNAKGVSSSGPAGGEADPQKLALRALDINPVYQSIRASLSQTDADLAELRGEIAEQQNQVAQLRSRVNTAPEIEAQLAQLNRDYEVNKAQYTALVQRLESARLSEHAEQSTEKIKFRIVEPPFVPRTPSGPKRVLLLSLVLVLALGAAAGTVLLLDSARPAFATRAMLQEVTGLPVLGSLSKVTTALAGPWYRRQGPLVSASIGLLVAAYVFNLWAAANWLFGAVQVAGPAP
jgi:polysaccharide chain length determinant protein (PEP-CTERM system associated)